MTDKEIESLKVENQSLRTAANSLKMHYEEAQEEIERLENENTAFGEIIKKQDDEISTLRKDLLKRQNLEESYSKSVKQFDKRLEKTVKLERAEAVKEFAERLKNEIINDTAYACDSTQHSGYYDYQIKIGDIPEYIDNLVKEMVGENNATT